MRPQIRDAKISPDKSKIAFTAVNKLYVMDLNTKEMNRLTEFVDETIEAMPAWSPDGREIVFVSWNNKDGGSIYKVRSDGRRDPVLLTQSQNVKEKGVFTYPVWNESGDKIVFIMGDEGSYKESYGPYAFKSSDKLMWISSNGGKLNYIDDSKGRSYPHFVKGEDRIYLYSSRNGLVSIKWDGTDEKKIVKVTGITTYSSKTPQQQVLL